MANGVDGGSDPRREIQRMVYEVLLDKIREDRFPSPSMMNLVEQGVDGQQLVDYAEALLEKVRNDRFPSPDMVKRLVNLA